MYKDYKEDFICTLHDNIKKICSKYIRKIENDDFDILNKEINIKISDLLLIMNMAKAAKIKGKHMEKRLIMYFNAIQKLGFVKKNKKNK